MEAEFGERFEELCRVQLERNALLEENEQLAKTLREVEIELGLTKKKLADAVQGKQQPPREDYEQLLQLRQRQYEEALRDTAELKHLVTKSEGVAQLEAEVESDVEEKNEIEFEAGDEFEEKFAEMIEFMGRKLEDEREKTKQQEEQSKKLEENLQVQCQSTKTLLKNWQAANQEMKSLTIAYAKLKAEKTEVDESLKMIQEQLEAAVKQTEAEAVLHIAKEQKSQENVRVCDDSDFEAEEKAKRLQEQQRADLRRKGSRILELEKKNADTTSSLRLLQLLILVLFVVLYFI
ncbi:hypothetical protein L596_015263 [Steinernema carpocapsae]|uniref:Uncharacterized protein n=1 Tax=Steinernema carpocapsae TaxID=34508 RepID=A0A4U5NEG3_STECR|nr:hypothetical protein L596_015263 [Steinernema carpocapsae]